jgi:hypothetical protein
MSKLSIVVKCMKCGEIIAQVVTVKRVDNHNPEHSQIVFAIEEVK